MMACPRWVLSAVTVSRVLVVKNAWNRQVSNRVGCPATALGLRSGIRRTTRRPGTCSLFFLDLNATKGISATSAREIQRPDGSSNTAFGYLIVVQASSGIVLITALMCLVCRTVMDTSAPAPAPAGGGDHLVPVERRIRPQQHRTSGAGGAEPLNLTVARVSATNRAAPRADPQDPFRRRCATTTGAACAVLTVPMKEFSPRTLV